MIIIGFDPGTRVTGFGVVKIVDNKIIPIDYGCIRPPAKMPLLDRYFTIFEAVLELIDRYNVEVVSVETQFMAGNAQVAIKLGMARMCIILAAKQKGLDVFEYSPKSAKRAVVGKASGSKQQVQQMLIRLLGLNETPTPEDAADALSLAICHAHSSRMHTLTK